MAALTLELMQSKLNDLHQQREKALGTLMAVDGAIQFAEHLINELNKPDEKPEEEKKVN